MSPRLTCTVSGSESCRPNHHVCIHVYIYLINNVHVEWSGLHPCQAHPARNEGHHPRLVVTSLHHCNCMFRSAISLRITFDAKSSMQLSDMGLKVASPELEAAHFLHSISMTCQSKASILLMTLQPRMHLNPELRQATHQHGPDGMSTQQHQMETSRHSCYHQRGARRSFDFVTKNVSEETKRACSFPTMDACRSNLRCCAEACSCCLAMSEAKNTLCPVPNPMPAVKPHLIAECALASHRGPNNAHEGWL